ncbi:hypothetical protein [Methylococcus sp. Mc7]|uniref:hypothetical protein n=1 Tax=Methylococcus sp. Mc7 TaxID=2860258 RepID=UPI001C530593|nr:hypothetical protein [Methylococcus sp. Mc7]QXP83311.1 hypothetical protein KW115_14185 [Methylococcus sp. Mc7]
MVFALRASLRLFNFAPGKVVAFGEGPSKGLLPLDGRAASLRLPFGLFSPKAAMLGAA